MTVRSDRTLTRVIGRGAALADRARRRTERLTALGRSDLAVPCDITVEDQGTVTAILPVHDGTDMGTLSRQRPPLSVEECAWLGTRVARAVAAMHDAGMVHGDISPGNILVQGDGVVLLDTLGVLGDDERGTPGFRAAERMAGEPCEASDVYSLAALLRWSASDAAVAAVTTAVRPMLDPDPACRPDIEGVRAALGALATESPVDMPGAADVATVMRSHAALHTERIAQGRMWRARRWALRLGTVGATVAVVALGVGFFVTGERSAPAVATEAAPTDPSTAVSPGPDVSESPTHQPDLADDVGAVREGDAARVAEDARTAAQRLTEARFEALGRGDAEALRAVVGGDSASAEHTRAIADQLEKGTRHWEGLTGRVTQASVLSASSHTAVVLVTYEVSAHTIIVDGQARDVPAQIETAIVELEATPRGWVVTAARPAPSPTAPQK